MDSRGDIAREHPDALWLLGELAGTSVSSAPAVGADSVGGDSVEGDSVRGGGTGVTDGVDEAPVVGAVAAGETSGEAPGPEAEAPVRRAWWRRSGVRWSLAVAGLCVAAVLVTRVVVFEPFTVPSSSMLPTLAPGDRILVDKVALDFRSIHRGDIVVFKTPKALGDEYPDLVKRVIGLPGDVLSEDQDGNVVVNGQDLNEPYLAPNTVTTGLPQGLNGYTVPPGEYFVMGDNRENSTDSRAFGPIPRSSIVGVVVARVWPPSRWGGV